jgi:hypothetical protein
MFKCNTGPMNVKGQKTNAPLTSFISRLRLIQDGVMTALFN